MKPAHFACTLIALASLCALPAAARPLGPAPIPPVVEREEEHEQPTGHLLPGLSGATGLVDMPVAYTLPRHRGMVTLQAEHVDAGAGYWPAVYRGVKANSQRVHAGWGVARDSEVTLTLENWNHELHYFDPLFGVDPDFNAENKLFGGIGGKRAFALADRVWGAVGARYQFFREKDRNVTELREYERTNHAYLAASWQATDSLYVHAMFKWVFYDWQGDRPASGAVGAFPGFSLPSSWSQPGLGLEWRFARHWSVAGEWVHDSNVDFLGGVGKNSANLAARFEERDRSFGVFLKRLDQDHLVYAGVQGGVGF